tara:strand:+ start:1140 stop:2753 length:1614 start_codon:yes stop_codon:yes gene_type:complete
MQSKILIIDFGSQVTQLIARRVREAGVYSEVFPHNINENFIKNFKADGIILSGSGNSVNDLNMPKISNIIFNLGVPILGICYGMQIMASELGGNVEIGNLREFGYAELRARGHSKLLKKIEDFKTVEGHGVLKVWMSHGDKVKNLPKGFKIIASTVNCPIAGMADETRNFYGLQFHPEVTHTRKGFEILKRFVVDICKSEPDWRVPKFLENSIAKIKSQVKDDNVILGLSGGVDSSVAALLIHRAIGNQLTCIFIDNGLLRLDESKMVLEMFSKNLKVNVIHIDASKQFLGKLKNKVNPEVKRKIIGNEFIKVFQNEAKKIKNVKWLAQGTIYSDIIESSVGNENNSKKIKSHHNVGGLPKDLNLKLLEPLKNLFKDEVRQLGVELGLKKEIVFRHPFPGPGLAIRILGEVKKEYISLLQKADSIYIQELKNAKYIVDKNLGDSVKQNVFNWYDAVSQAFVVFLPIRTVGVMGDKRTYDFLISLRAVQTEDFMTAKWAPIPHSLLDKISNRIINEVPGINRVLYDISGKPPSTIEWE